MKKRILITFLLLAIFFSGESQVRVGDPNVTFDQSKRDPDYPQMAIWETAGVRGGIPYINQLDIKRTLNPTNSAGIQSAINAVANQGGGAILLKNGTYNIDLQVNMKSKVILVGESRDGVICQIHRNIDRNNKNSGINDHHNDPKAWDDGNGAFKFENISYSGIYRLTINGGWGVPKLDWNIGSNANNELPGNENMSIWFMKAKDCWVDGVTILNSADYPVRCIGDHITMRDLYVDGVFNKQGGGHGYFFLLQGASHNLITESFITHLRHISLQGGGVEYNVVYGNKFEQELSFHSGDDGNNLIENNRFVLPKDMPGTRPNYVSIMGPWSKQHHISSKPNYVYKNTCLEKNHNDATPWSNPNKIYDGPYVVRPNPGDLNALWNNFRARPNNKLPTGGTLYPINLNSSCSVGSPCNDGDECTVNDVLDANCNCIGEDSNQDSDNDTICDAVDQCPNFDDRLIGTPCDDGNICTFNDVYTSNCNCEGTITSGNVELIPTDDAYLQTGTLFNNNYLRLEEGRRVSYMKFDLSGITDDIENISLKLTVADDSGSGTINIYKSNNTNWTENNLTASNAPNTDNLVGSFNGDYTTGNSYTVDLNSINELKFSIILVHQGGNDVSFNSKNATNNSKPKLIITTNNDNCNLSSDNTDNSLPISIYPNPAKDILNIDFKNYDTRRNLSLTIVDALGSLVYDEKYDNSSNNVNKKFINVNEWSSGLYFIIIQDNAKRNVVKLIIE